MPARQVDARLHDPDHRPMGVIQRRNFDEPDEVRHFPLGTGELMQIGTYTIGRAGGADRRAHR